MKRQFVAATLGMGMAAFACNAAFAADKMSAGDRTTDMRVKCEQMTGNDRLACLDSAYGAHGARHTFCGKLRG